MFALEFVLRFYCSLSINVGLSRETNKLILIILFIYFYIMLLTSTDSYGQFRVRQQLVIFVQGELGYGVFWLFALLHFRNTLYNNNNI